MQLTQLSMPKKNKKLPPNVHVKRNGKWEVRVSYDTPDAKSKRRWMHQTLQTKDRAEADEVARKMKLHVEKIRSGVDLKPIPITFGSVVRRYKQSECQPPVYRNGKVVSGKRSAATAIFLLMAAEAYFGHRNPRHITYGELKAFKELRLSTPIVSPKGVKRDRSIASVNRELGVLRALFTYAMREGWIDVNPFLKGPSLIRLADENRRSVLWSEDEEHQILQFCTGRLAYMKAFIQLITYGGYRRGEILAMKWSMVDLKNDLITLPPELTKNNRERVIPIHPIVKAELQALKRTNAFVFGGIKYPATSWHSLRAKIGRPDLHLHDLRAVCTTRLLNNGVPIHLIQALLGHSVGKESILMRHYARTEMDDLKRAVLTLPSGRWQPIQSPSYAINY